MVEVNIEGALGRFLQRTVELPATPLLA